MSGWPNVAIAKSMFGGINVFKDQVMRFYWSGVVSESFKLLLSLLLLLLNFVLKLCEDI